MKLNPIRIILDNSGNMIDDYTILPTINQYATNYQLEVAFLNDMPDSRMVKAIFNINGKASPARILSPTLERIKLEEEVYSYFSHTYQLTQYETQYFQNELVVDLYIYNSADTQIASVTIRLPMNRQNFNKLTPGDLDENNSSLKSITDAIFDLEASVIEYTGITGTDQFETKSDALAKLEESKNYTDGKFSVVAKNYSTNQYTDEQNEEYLNKSKLYTDEQINKLAVGDDTTLGLAKNYTDTKVTSSISNHNIDPLSHQDIRNILITKADRTQLQSYYNRDEIDELLSKVDLSKDYATKDYVGIAIENELGELVGSSPELLNTLEELSKALGDDPNFATTITGELANKQDKLTDGVNIKTINGQSILGTGDIEITSSGAGSNVEVNNIISGNEPKIFSLKVDNVLYRLITNYNELDNVPTNLVTTEILTEREGALKDYTNLAISQSNVGLKADLESYTDEKVASLVDSSPETLNTLKELSKALGDDPNFATTITNKLGSKLNISTYETDKGVIEGKITTLEENTNTELSSIKDDIRGLSGNKANTSDLSRVALTGDFDDLTDKPTFLNNAVVSNNTLILQKSDGGIIAYEAVNSYKDLKDAPTKLSEFTNDLDLASNSEIVKLTNRISTEETRAQSAERDIQDSVSVETNRATASEKLLETSIQSEKTRAEQAERNLSSDIQSETSRATSAESNIRDSVTNLETTLKSYTDTKVADLVSSSPEALNTLKELADALGNDPNFATTISTEIGTKASKTELTDAINTEKNRAIEVETNLQTSISNEITRAQGVEDNLQTAIDNEINRASATEEAIQKSITTLSQNLNLKVNNLETTVNTNKTELQTSINTVKKDLEQAIEDIDVTGDLSTVAVTGEYKDLLNYPTKLSEFSNDIKAYTPNTIIYSDTEPSNPTENMIWLDPRDADITRNKIFDTLQEMVDTLNSELIGTYNPGDVLLIIEEGVPDFWVTSIAASSVTGTIPDDWESATTFQFGYYVLAVFQSDTTIIYNSNITYSETQPEEPKLGDIWLSPTSAEFFDLPEYSEEESGKVLGIDSEGQLEWVEGGTGGGSGNGTYVEANPEYDIETDGTLDSIKIGEEVYIIGGDQMQFSEARSASAFSLRSINIAGESWGVADDCIDSEELETILLSKNYATQTDLLNAISAVKDSAPEAFDTLKEISDWIAADETGTAALTNKVTANETAITTLQTGKQDTLVSGTNIKTINGESILGEGDIAISGGGGSSVITVTTQGEFDTLFNSDTPTFSSYSEVILDGSSGVTFTLTTYTTLNKVFTISGVNNAKLNMSASLVGRADAYTYPAREVPCTLRNLTITGTSSVNIEGFFLIENCHISNNGSYPRGMIQYCEYIKDCTLNNLSRVGESNIENCSYQWKSSSISSPTIYKCSCNGVRLLSGTISSVNPILFNTCTNLSNIYFAEDVRLYSGSASSVGLFYDCKNVSNVYLRFVSISYPVFYSCRAISNVFVPGDLNELTNTSRYMIAECSNVDYDSVTLMGGDTPPSSGGLPEIGEDDEGGFLRIVNGAWVISKLENAEDGGF